MPVAPAPRHRCLLDHLRPLARSSLGLGLTLALGVGIGACKRQHEPSCAPADHGLTSITVHVQAAAELNLDADGAPLPTVVRVYQLSGDLATRSLDFAELWDDPKAALKDEYISDKEFQVYPDSHEAIEITPDPQARYLLAFAGFRQPVGNTWFRVYAIPTRYGEQVCAHADAGEDPASLGPPCVYLTLERNQIDGGERVPPGFDEAAIAGRCAPPIALSPDPGSSPESSPE
jgi:type VI secretion system protein VasD